MWLRHGRQHSHTLAQPPHKSSPCCSEHQYSSVNSPSPAYHPDENQTITFTRIYHFKKPADNADSGKQM